MAAEASGLRALLVEAFTAIPCAGNGAAVVLLEAPMEEAWLQGVATSLRQSETAFLLQGPRGWLLRWFTPSCEVPLCGHATLAALLALGHWGLLAPGQATALLSRSGPLAVELVAGAPGWGRLELPSGSLVAAPSPPQLGGDGGPWALGPLQGFWTSALGYSVALLPSEAPLAGLELPAAALEGSLRRGLVLMQALGGASAAAVPRLGREQADYQLRFFAPGLGIPEDPVTGSAHALVAPWWMKRLGRERVVGWQCSDRPGGMVCEAASSGMIRLTGSGHLLWDGTLRTASPGWDGSSEAAPEQALAAAWNAWRTAIPCGWSTPSGAIPS